MWKEWHNVKSEKKSGWQFESAWSGWDETRRGKEMMSWVSIAVDEQMSVGRSGRLGKKERWLNERGVDEEHISLGTYMCYEYGWCWFGPWSLAFVLHCWNENCDRFDFILKDTASVINEGRFWWEFQLAESLWCSCLTMQSPYYFGFYIAGYMFPVCMARCSMHVATHPIFGMSSSRDTCLS